MQFSLQEMGKRFAHDNNHQAAEGITQPARKNSHPQREAHQQPRGNGSNEIEKSRSKSGGECFDHIGVFLYLDNSDPFFCFRSESRLQAV